METSNFNKKEAGSGTEQQHSQIEDRTSPALSTRSARAEDEDTKLTRSPGIKILEMAGQAPVYKCKFSVNDFRLRNPTVPDDASDEYDTDLESEEIPTARKAFFHDTTGKQIYLEACKHYEVIPASYFTRNISSEVVNLAHHGLGANGIKAIVVALLQNTRICELDLQDNAIGDESGKDVATMFFDNFYITKLNMAYNMLGLQTAKGFAESLEGNGALRILDLSENMLCNKCIEVLCSGLVNNYSLAELHLSKNKITEEGGKYIGAMLAEQHSLTYLDLSWNGLGSHGSESVLKGLKENIILKNLNLAWNAIGVDGCKALSKALCYMNLQCLSISNNRLLAEGAKTIAQGLKKNTSLKTIKIGHNILENTGVCAVLKAILRNTESQIRTIDISGTDLEKEFYELEKELRSNGRTIKFIHETKCKEKPPKRITDPREILKRFLEENGIHKLDLFDFFDRDASMSISVDEFKKGLKSAKCGLADFQIDELMELLDKDHDGEIDYSEFSEL